MPEPARRIVTPFGVVISEGLDRIQLGQIPLIPQHLGACIGRGAAITTIVFVTLLE